MLLIPKRMRRIPEIPKKILELIKLIGTREDIAYPRTKNTRHMAAAKLQPTATPLRTLLLMPTEYVRYIVISEIEQGERKVTIPRKNRLRGSSNIMVMLTVAD